MTNRKKMLVAASIAGLMAASSSVAMAGSAFPGQDAGNKSHCDMHGCKGAHSCKGDKHSCKGGNNACKGHANGCKGAAADTAAAATDGQLTGK